jgi:hypothetical protein
MPSCAARPWTDSTASVAPALQDAEPQHTELGTCGCPESAHSRDQAVHRMCGSPVFTQHSRTLSCLNCRVMVDDVFSLSTPEMPSTVAPRPTRPGRISAF